MTIFSIVGCTIDDNKTRDYDYIQNISEYFKLHGINKSKIEELGKYTNLQYYSRDKDEYGLFDVNNEYYLIKKISEFTTFQLNQDEVISYSLTIVKRFEELAEIQGLSLEEYYNKELDINEEQFYSLCYKMGEFDIKTKLIVFNVAMEEGICIESRDISDYCHKNNISKVDISKKDESSLEIFYNILENKVYTFLANNNKEK